MCRKSTLADIWMASLPKKFWVEPENLPYGGDVSDVEGNVSQHVKQLALNTLMAYGVGDQDAFGYAAGRKIKLTYANAEEKEKGKLEVTAITEVVVDRCAYSFELLLIVKTNLACSDGEWE